MAYSFQTFVNSQILTSTQMNQVESNIKDHIHGEAGVVGSYARMDGAAMVVASALCIGDSDGLNANLVRGDNSDFVYHELSTGKNTHAKRVFVNANSGGSYAFVWDTTTYSNGKQFGFDPAGYDPGETEIGFYTAINSFAASYLGENTHLKGALVIQTNSMLLLKGNRAVMVLERHAYLNANKTSVHSINADFGVLNNVSGPDLTVIGGMPLSFDLKMLGGGNTLHKFRRDQIGYFHSTDLYMYGGTVTNTSYVDLNGLYTYISTNSASYISNTKYLREKIPFELNYRIQGRLTSGQSDLVITITTSPFVNDKLTVMCAQSGTSVISGGLFDMIKTTLSSGNAFSQSGTVRMFYNSYPGTDTIRINFITSVASGIFKSFTSSGDIKQINYVW